MNEVSGVEWCDKFPTSTSLADLIEPFRDKVHNFILALQRGGAAISISTTHRPAERAYLMHFACLVAGYTDKEGERHQIPPGQVPPMKGVDIDWTHGGNIAEAVAAAKEMVAKYDIAYPAALDSRHIEGRAIDMTIHIPAGARIMDSTGTVHEFAEATNGQDARIVGIGLMFGVHKLATDPPHWSDDGH